MKKIAKILAMFAIFALAFSFAGCKSDDSDSSDDDVTILAAGQVLEAVSRFQRGL